MYVTKAWDPLAYIDLQFEAANVKELLNIAVDTCRSNTVSGTALQLWLA